jgi:phytoene synthase
VSRDTNFYYSFLVLPPEKRRAIVAVWDLCRAVDDAADEPGVPGAAAVAAGLAAWRAEIAACFDGGEPRTPQGRALLPFIERFGLPRQPFDDLVDGVAMDVGHCRFETFAELREYCYRVASTVGLICVEIFGYAHPGSRQYAVNLGLALQLTNILRDVGVDLARGRLYLPLEDLARFGCDEDALRRGEVTPSVRALLAHQAARARGMFEAADAALPREDRRRLAAAQIMAAIYRGILDKIEARGFDVFSEVVRLPRPRRALIAASTWARVAAGLR